MNAATWFAAALSSPNDMPSFSIPSSLMAVAASTAVHSGLVWAYCSSQWVGLRLTDCATSLLTSWFETASNSLGKCWTSCVTGSSGWAIIAPTKASIWRTKRDSCSRQMTALSAEASTTRAPSWCWNTFTAMGCSTCKPIGSSSSFQILRAEGSFDSVFVMWKLKMAG